MVGFEDDEDPFLPKRFSPKQAKVVTTFIFEGFEAADIKALLPSLQQHLNAGEARKAVNQNLSSAMETPDKRVCVPCSSMVTLEGFQACEANPLRRDIKRFTSFDDVEEPTDLP